MSSCRGPGPLTLARPRSSYTCTELKQLHAKELRSSVFHFSFYFYFCFCFHFCFYFCFCFCFYFYFYFYFCFY